jgi:hypothetical protein
MFIKGDFDSKLQAFTHTHDGEILPMLVLSYLFLICTILKKNTQHVCIDVGFAFLGV